MFEIFSYTLIKVENVKNTDGFVLMKYLSYKRQLSTNFDFAYYSPNLKMSYILLRIMKKKNYYYFVFVCLCIANKSHLFHFFPQYLKMCIILRYCKCYKFDHCYIEYLKRILPFVKNKHLNKS